MDVPQQMMSSANTLYSTTLQLASGLGIGIGALALRFVASTSANPHSLAHYQLSFVLIAIVGLIALIGYGKMEPEAGKIITN